LFAQIAAGELPRGFLALQKIRLHFWLATEFGEGVLRFGAKMKVKLDVRVRAESFSPLWFPAIGKFRTAAVIPIPAVAGLSKETGSQIIETEE